MRSSREKVVSPRSAAIIQNQQQLAAIFGLNRDTLTEIFGYLSLKNLAKFGQTCKSMQQMAGEYFQENFKSKFIGENGEIRTMNFTKNIDIFSQFVHSIYINDGNLKVFCSLNFSSLKEIKFSNCELEHIECLENVLPHVESIKFSYLNYDIHKTILDSCKNLKKLFVKEISSIGTSSNWINKNYPNLEHFEYILPSKNDEVVEFLKNNKKIRQFSTTIEFLIANYESISASKVTLEVLSILHQRTDLSEAAFNNFMTQMTDLKERRFFQQLDLYYLRSDKFYNYPPNLLSAVRLLNIHNHSKLKITSADLLNLEQLFIHNTTQIRDFDVAPNNLQKLKFLYISDESFVNVLPFVQHSPKIREIKIFSPDNEPRNRSYYNFFTSILNLTKLNEERRNCATAKKLTFYMCDRIYLATKSAFSKNEYDFVEIKRHDSHDEMLDFWW